MPDLAGAGVSKVMSVLREQLGAAEGLERIEQMLRFRTGEVRPDAAPLQWGTGLFVPGLRARPWHDPSSFDWAAAVEERWRAAADELPEVQRRGVGQPYADAPAGDPEDRDRQWTAYFLARGGEWIEPNASLAPTMRRIVGSTPMGPGEALVSVLPPGARIALHSGPWNFVLTCHLPLVVPPDCAIAVAGEERGWEPGRLLVFDDSFAHSAWNDSRLQRVCLLWEVWHPDLTRVEREALRVLLRQAE